VVEALYSALNESTATRSVTVNQLSEGMILDENLMTARGDLMLPKGQEIDGAVLQIIGKMARTPAGVQEPIRVRCPIEPASTDTVPTLALAMS
jgi:hypothetical protein